MFAKKMFYALGILAICTLLFTTSANAGLWTPSEITTTMWFDAEDGSTITLGANGVSNWADKSGNGFDVSQGSDDRRPDLLAGGWSNGNDSLALTQYSTSTARKDTLGRNVSSDGISGSAYTLFVVVDAQSVDSEEWIHTSLTTSGKENRTQINNNGVKVRSDASNGGSASGTYVPGEQILQFTLDSTLSEVRRNGTQIAGNSGTFTPSALTGNFSINGRNPIDGHAGMTGEIGEFIYLASNPSTEDRQLIEGYLAWKWGLEASLPSGHPYENAAPVVIPEPASLALMGLGGLAMLVRRRRR
jgi:hypothetical protein